LTKDHFDKKFHERALRIREEQNEVAKDDYALNREIAKKVKKVKI